jgi:hypothetical protein
MTRSIRMCVLLLCGSVAAAELPVRNLQVYPAEVKLQGSRGA